MNWEERKVVGSGDSRARFSHFFTSARKKNETQPEPCITLFVFRLPMWAWKKVGASACACGYFSLSVCWLILVDLFEPITVYVTSNNVDSPAPLRLSPWSVHEHHLLWLLKTKMYCQHPFCKALMKQAMMKKIDRKLRSRSPVKRQQYIKIMMKTWCLTRCLIMKLFSLPQLSSFSEYLMKQAMMKKIDRKLRTPVKRQQYITSGLKISWS